MNTTKIGIHVRRGDIGEQQKLAPWSYFQQAMSSYRQKYNQVHFFVASNDPQWVKSHFNDTLDVTYLTGSAYEDMAVLIECDHIILSVGTYGYWCAMLAQGTVIYYAELNRQWVGQLYKDADYFMPHWISRVG